MSSFYDLLRLFRSSAEPDGSLALAQQKIDDLFPAVVAKSPFRLWAPGDAIAAQGKRLLIGVATWSGLDMQFLDFLARRLQEVPGGLIVEVFNVASCPSQDALERYIPGIGMVFQTPVVGFWSDGKLVDKRSGKPGRELVARAAQIDLPGSSTKFTGELQEFCDSP